MGYSRKGLCFTRRCQETAVPFKAFCLRGGRLNFARIEMRTRKNWVAGAGIVIALIGLGALPLGIGVSPKRDTSFFNNLADTGMFITYGLVLILIGIVVLIVSAFIPPHDEEGA